MSGLLSTPKATLNVATRSPVDGCCSCCDTQTFLSPFNDASMLRLFLWGTLFCCGLVANHVDGHAAMHGWVNPAPPVPVEAIFH